MGLALVVDDGDVTTPRHGIVGCGLFLGLRLDDIGLAHVTLECSQFRNNRFSHYIWGGLVELGWQRFHHCREHSCWTHIRFGRLGLEDIDHFIFVVLDVVAVKRGFNDFCNRLDSLVNFFSSFAIHRSRLTW